MRLFDLYGVPRPSVFSDENEARWTQLALCLAFVHVPGLQFEPMPGRPKTWGYHQCTKLYVDVLLKMRLSNLPLSRACYYLAGDQPWRSFVQLRVKGDSEARKKHIGDALRSKFNEMQKQNHSAIELVKKIEDRWPEQFNEKLKIISERYNWKTEDNL